MRKIDSLTENESIRVVITLHPNGALSIEGPIHDQAFCIALLENAIDAVRGHGVNRGLVVPGRDVSVPEVQQKNTLITMP